MTRDQAVAIINNIELIKAFAEGKQIGVEISGKLFPTNTLCLTNFRSDRPINYRVMEPTND